MKLIIDIPEHDKNVIERFVRGDGCEDMPSSIIENLIRAVYFGTPLPKGHGRLIDADALKKDDETVEWLSINPIRTGKMLNQFSKLFVKKIDDAPTIIEADKGDKE